MARTVSMFAKLTWHTFAGGTSAKPGTYGYSAHPSRFGEYHIQAPHFHQRGGYRGGYTVMYANTDGVLTGGLWSTVGKARSPQAAKRMAQEHFEALVKAVILKIRSTS